VKVLIAEDEPVSRLQLQGLLRKWGYTVETAADGHEALRCLELAPDSPRLVILDRMMPGVDGLDVCRAVRKRGTEPYVYVILLTGQDRQENVLEGFDAGADDYIKKPFEVQELKARLQTGARIVELQQQLITAREQQRFQGLRDSLTHILNRVAFFEIFEREVARARRVKSALTLIMCDIDHFKRINDNFGHLAGDAVLRETARRLRTSQRASDAVARYGGEEFVILAPDCGPPGAVSVAERFRAAVSASPMNVGDMSLTVTMSFGLASTSDMDAAQGLLKAADEALYRAKEQGRNRVVTT
jgi:diguanylate cyclase (GGDEF)-like protein